MDSRPVVNRKQAVSSNGCSLRVPVAAAAGACVCHVVRDSATWCVVRTGGGLQQQPHSQLLTVGRSMWLCEALSCCCTVFNCWSSLVAQLQAWRCSWLSQPACGVSVGGPASGRLPLADLCYTDWPVGIWHTLQIVCVLCLYQE